MKARRFPPEARCNRQAFASSPESACLNPDHTLIGQLSGRSEPYKTRPCAQNKVSFFQMLSALPSLFDPAALIVVVTGTWLATAARCGRLAMLEAVRAMGGLWASPFDENANRAALARTASAIRSRGPLCADTPLPPDHSMAIIVESYLSFGSIEALQNTARGERIARSAKRSQGQSVFENAGELAPVFGLVGTLFAITQLSPGADLGTSDTAFAAIAAAVLSSLYGVLSAQFVYLPLARAIERRGNREERTRAAILDWFESEISGSQSQRLRAHKTAA